jgi:uncharacterized membrane protein
MESKQQVVDSSLRRFRRPAVFIAAFLPALLLLALPLYRPTDLPFFFLFIGRFHPLVLHFPIVLIILALLFEIARHYSVLKLGDIFFKVILIAAAVTTLVSIGAGFFLFASGEYSGDLMERHFWLGAFTGTAIFTTVGLFYAYLRDNRFYWAYFAALAITNGAVAYTSHLGGSITHGKDYLTEHLSVLGTELADTKSKSENDMLLYRDVVVPVFEAKCLSCHNPQKSKGGLLMNSYASLLKAGESGIPSMTPGDPEKSEIFNRVHLPLDHKDHMPPAGKTPMTEDEVSILKFWIERGSSDTLSVSHARKEQNIGPAIERVLPELLRYRRNALIAQTKAMELDADLKELAIKLNVSIERDTVSDGDFYTIAMKFPPAPFTNEQFRALSPYFEVFSKVSLIASGIDDAGLYYISKMVNLKELYLQKTNIDGSGLLYLTNLPKLERLNLSFTKIDDRAAIDLLKVPKLKEVYLYRTNTTKEVIEALSKNKPSLSLLVEEGPYF